MRRAERDLDEIQRYLDIDAPRASGRVIDGLLEAIESLADIPLRGAVPSDPDLERAGYRFLAQAPYLVFYKVRGRTVRIFRVLHGRRNWWRLLR
jgi:plasmid stabilization system protein ParE